MSKLSIEQKTVNQLLGDNQADFLIPDYQRPYAWEEKECQKLWDDIFEFAFPDGDANRFDWRNDKYFLGPIVTFSNANHQEVIDGQQRLTTLMLLLRAFHVRLEEMADEDAVAARQSIEKCVWKTGEFGNKPDMSSFKLDSEAVTDEARQELRDILRTGKTSHSQTSSYAQNYRLFQDKIATFFNEKRDWFSYFPMRLLNNCVLLPIEAESQNTALRIFSTLNDRGKPLSDSDIFKAQLYKYYAQSNRQEEFIARWKDLEERCEKVYEPRIGTPMDEAFNRYRYYAQAKQGEKDATTSGLRKFYEKDGYALLKQDKTFDDVIDLVEFWSDVDAQSTRFSDRINKRLFVLHCSPNSMWTYIVSVYYLTYRDKDGMLNEEKFYSFLNRITAFIWTHMLLNPALNTLRPPLFTEMISIVNGEPANFRDYRFDPYEISKALQNYRFSNKKALTRSMLAWWTFHSDKQPLLLWESRLGIERIYPEKRQEEEHGLSDERNLELLGNKSLLESRLKIPSSDYRFADKVKIYKGNGRKRKGTQIHELRELANTHKDFGERDIERRNELIFSEFVRYLQANGLLHE